MGFKVLALGIPFFPGFCVTHDLGQFLAPPIPDELLQSAKVFLDSLEALEEGRRGVAEEVQPHL